MDKHGHPEANTEITNERAGVLCLVIVADYAPTAENCPFREIRKKNWGEQIRWVQQLTDLQIREMVAFHKTCPLNKDHKPTLL